MRPSIATILVLGALLLLASPAAAHGSGWRGPPDPVPPPPPTQSGPSDTSPGAPAPPRSPGSSERGTPGMPVVQRGTQGRVGGALPGGSGPGSPGPATGGASPLDDVDLARWQYWWELNKDPFLRLKQAIATDAAGFEAERGVVSHSDQFFMGPGRARAATDLLLPTPSQIRTEVWPALRHLLGHAEQRDVVTATLIALAKIARDEPDLPVLPLIRQRLASKDQQIRETATLAIGIAGLHVMVPDLAALLTDSNDGRALVGRGEVSTRTRAFAAYALGLLAGGAPPLPIQRTICKTLANALERIDDPSRDLEVAIVNALGLVRVDAADPHATAVLDYCVDSLHAYYERDVGPAEQLAQAHVPTAIAKLCRRHSSTGHTARFRDRYVTELVDSGPRARANRAIRQSAALALGRLTRPWDDDSSPDRAVSEALWRYYREGKDQQAGYFCLIALAQIGGGANRAALLAALETSSRAMQKPWVALALGIHAAERPGAPDPEIGAALLTWFERVKTPETRAALAVALGLARHTDATDELLAALAANAHQDELAGYLCIGLALLDAPRAIEPIRQIVQRSTRRPELLQQAAVALGKLGDKHAADLLQAMLVEGEPNLARSGALAAAIGYIGDRRSISPLLRLSTDDSAHALSRAFAVAALGSVADRRPLPWATELCTDLNYRAAVASLTNQIDGILDIL